MAKFKNGDRVVYQSAAAPMGQPPVVWFGNPGLSPPVEYTVPPDICYKIELNDEFSTPVELWACIRWTLARRFPFINFPHGTVQFGTPNNLVGVLFDSPEYSGLTICRESDLLLE